MSNVVEQNKIQVLIKIDKKQMCPHNQFFNVEIYPQFLFYSKTLPCYTPYGSVMSTEAFNLYYLRRNSNTLFTALHWVNNIDTRHIRVFKAYRLVTCMYM